MGSRIAFFLVLVAMTAALLFSGCAVGYTQAYPDDGYQPDLVYAAPGVQVIADYDEPIFFSDGFYWRSSGGYWYRSHSYRGGWVGARPPVAVMRVEHPQTYAHYRPQGWAPRGRPVPPPRYEARGAPPHPMYQAAPPPRAQPQNWRGAPAPAPPPRAQPQGWRAAPVPQHGAPAAPRPAPPSRGNGEHHDHR